MNIPNEVAYPVIAVAWAISFSLMIYLIKVKLPDTGAAIEKAVEKKVDAKIKSFVDNELPIFIEDQGPKLVTSLLKDLTKRIQDPKEEELADIMSAMAFAGMAAFRANLQDPDFKREVDSYINGKMNYVRNQLEKSLPGILIKAAPELKKAFVGGGGKEGGMDPMQMIMGMIGGGGDFQM